MSAHRPCRDAATLDRRVSQVRVVDPQHPLYGRCFAVSEHVSERGLELIMVRLLDGRQRSVPRSATDLAGTAYDWAVISSRQSHISVRTLLPLANHVRAVLASKHADCEADGRHGGQAPARPDQDKVRRNAGHAAAPVAAASNRDTASARAARGSASPAPATAQRSRTGGTLCRRRRR